MVILHRKFFFKAKKEARPRQQEKHSMESRMRKICMYGLMRGDVILATPRRGSLLYKIVVSRTKRKFWTRRVGFKCSKLIKAVVNNGRTSLKGVILVDILGNRYDLGTLAAGESKSVTVSAPAAAGPPLGHSHGRGARRLRGLHPRRRRRSRPRLLPHAGHAAVQHGRDRPRRRWRAFLQDSRGQPRRRGAVS